jgi:hypothetical protein
MAAVARDGASFTGDAVYVRVKDISSGQEVFVALGAWDTVGVLKKRLEGKGMGGFDQQRLVHSGRILANDETLMTSGIAKAPQVRALNRAAIELLRAVG